MFMLDNISGYVQQQYANFTLSNVHVALQPLSTPLLKVQQELVQHPYLKLSR